jgi:UDP-glucuronate decarboxylase
LDVVEEDVGFLVKRLNEDGGRFTDQTILVIGGAGFLGSWICDVLVRQGGRVICLDNFSSGRRDNVEHLESLDRFRLVEHDISQPIFFDEQIDLVFHMASRASPMEFSRFPIQILKSNTLGTWVALGIAKKHMATLVYASSSEVYGDPDPRYIPTPESYYGNVNPVGVRSCYDEAKRAAEAFITAYHIQHGVDARIVRIHNTYGPRMRAGDVYGRVVTRFIDQALRGVPLTVFGDGRQTRSFTYVTDMVRGILKVAYVLDLSGEVFNLGSGEEMEIIGLAKTVLELTESDSEIEFQPLPPDDPRRRCPDTSKAERLLKWKAETSLKEGLHKTISWLKEQQLRN